MGDWLSLHSRVQSPLASRRRGSPCFQVLSPLVEHVTCNLCGSDDDAVLYADLPDMLLQRKEVTATLVRCRRCSLIYQNPRPTLGEMGQHYPSHYDAYHYDRELRQRNWLKRWAAEYGIDKRCRYVTRYKQSGALLDIGCATGLFLDGMRRRGNWELLGLEPSAPAAEAARRLGLRVITGTLEETDFPTGHFDVVTLWDVIEHLHDPAGALRRIARILKPGGILVIRTPNFDSWEARLFGRYWAGLEPPRHLFVFTPQTLGAMLAQAGFAIRHQDCRSGGYMAFLRSVQFRLTFTRLSDRPRTLLMRVLYHPLARAIAAPFFTLSSLGLRGGQMVLITSTTSESP